MANPPEQLDELLKLVRDEDVATLRALEQPLHSLLEQKERDEAIRRQGQTDRDLLSKHCPNVSIDPVGIQPESSVHDHKGLIREIITR